MSEREYVVVDIQTGEIVNQIKDGDRIVRGTSIESFTKNNNNIKLNEKEQFIKLYVSVIKDLVKEKISEGEWKVILVCLDHLSYVTGGVIHKTTNNFMSYEEIMEESGLSRASIFRAIDNLVKKKILHIGKTGRENQLFMNPFIFMRGCYINNTLYSMFRNSKWNKRK